MKLASAIPAAFVIWTAFVAPSISTSGGELGRRRPDVLILERLKDVGLSSAQTVAIKKLSAELDSRLADVEAKAAPTPAQRAARDQALRKVIAEGKRGALARPTIAAAFALTNEQRRAAAQIGIVRDELNRSVFSLLTETQKTLLAASAHRLEGYTGFIVVRLAADVPRELDDAKSLDDIARAQNLNGLREVIVAFGLTDTERLVRFVPDSHAPDPDRQRDVDGLARRLRSYWRIDARSKNAAVDLILRRLQATPGIDFAYRESAVGSPSQIDPADNPFFPLQGYLDPAPAGIDARFAWSKRGGDGAGVGLVDVEDNWNTNHEDLKGQVPTLIFGDETPGDHGTGVLGEVVAQDNRVGVVGVAPCPAYVFLTSWLEIGAATDRLVEGIVLSAILMNQGDVMLLEVERDYKPVELWAADFDAVRFATSLGIVVIEPAANGAYDLDTTPDHAGRFVLNRASADFRDSGSIMIGASDPIDSHNRAPFSCFGSRVDCFAWGRYVVTCGGGDLDTGAGDPNKTYRKAFNGTSASAPIVAGAAMILQARRKARGSRPLTSGEMRSLLADPGTGTLQGPRVPGNIGVMPNLRAVIDAEDAGRYRKNSR